MKKRYYQLVLLCLFTLICAIVCRQGKKTEQKSIDFFVQESIAVAQDLSKVKRLVMVVAPRAFRDEEFRVPYELLIKIGHKIRVASRDTILAVGINGLALKPQLSIKDIDTTQYDGIILVGGTGAAIYWDDKNVHQLVQHFANAHNKIVAAICIAPVILARAGVLNGVKATVYEDRATINELKQKGAWYQKADVVVCNNIIT
ncbi:MAG: DJ-1/PfpI family protein, partial [candidate division WOR-3 bacterium]|nr:DJ-1/PfpI family protein [candidate division WOR-3 bacterium]